MHDRPKLQTSPVRWAVALIATLGALAVGLPDAHAQQVAQPVEGRQHFSLGLSLQPGFMIDSGAPTGDVSFATAGLAHFGLTHLINRHFFMSAEVKAGVQWMRPHSASKSGVAPSSKGFTGQGGIYGHYLPFGKESGWVVNAGAHLFSTSLKDASLQVLAGELRLGRYIWSDDEQFLLVQLGYALPILQGLKQPNDYDANEWADENWSFHRFSLGFQYGF